MVHPDPTHNGLDEGFSPDYWRTIEADKIKAKHHDFDADFWRGYELYCEAFLLSDCDTPTMKAGWKAARLGHEDTVRAEWLAEMRKEWAA